MRSILFCLVVSCLTACHHDAPAAKAPIAPGATTKVATVQAQIEQGTQLYVANCAKCHGDGGQGVVDRGPPVVGPDAFPLHPRAGAKRDVDFHTAADVFAWTTLHMPAGDPGSLSTDEYLAIFAFDLTANGITLDAPLDGAKAQTIVLHP